MFFHWLFFFCTFILDIAMVRRIGADEKDLEILILRQQLRIVERRQPRGPTIPRWQKVPLIAVAISLRERSSHAKAKLQANLLLFKPETLLRWHRELVRRKWTFKQTHPGGRPRINPETENLVLRLAHENPRWGYDRIAGELGKLGIIIDPTTVKNSLKRHHVPPAPQRGKTTWRAFLNHYKQQMLACDFLTVETLGLQTLYILFFIHLGTRRVYFAGCTAQPEQGWVTQQARQFVWELGETCSGAKPMRFLIHDRDTKFSSSFNHVFISEGINIVLTPCRAPKANAVAERWIRSLREECLDHLLILNQQHLQRVVKEYVHFYNTARPHQGLEQQAPSSPNWRDQTGNIRSRMVLGGILRDYYRDAA